MKYLCGRGAGSDILRQLRAVLPTQTDRAKMTKEVEGCGKQDAPLTLYHIPAQGNPMPLGDGYIRLRCGHVAQQEATSYGLLLCEECAVRLDFPPMK